MKCLNQRVREESGEKVKKQPSARMAFIVGGLREPLKDHVVDNHGQPCTLE